MTTSITLIGGAVIGMAAGSLLVPLTDGNWRHPSSASSSAGDAQPAPDPSTEPRVTWGHWIALAAAWV